MSVIHPNKRYRLKDDGEERVIDITGVKGERAYGFCVETDCQVVLDNISELIDEGRLEPVER